MDAENAALYRQVYGPRDPSQLYLQRDHRSEKLYRGQVLPDEVLNSTHTPSNQLCWFGLDARPEDRVVMHPRVLDMLYDLGFYQVVRVGAVEVDCHLITALVERWRPETHTFHLTTGEATITLQDVALIWGLPIDGQPLAIGSRDLSTAQWRTYLRQLTGFDVEPGNMKSKCKLKIVPLKAYLWAQEINDGTDQVVLEQYVRGLILLMLGSILTPDTGRNTVSLHYLTALEDLGVVRQCSWGSAVLACLYRALCDCATGDKVTLVGPVTLLQVWAISRIRSLQPTNLRQTLDCTTRYGPGGRELGIPCYGARWIGEWSRVRTTRWCLRAYRNQLDVMRPDDFDWTPYDMNSADIMVLDHRCRAPHVWMTICPLINMHIVELHHANRVLRQFR